MLDGDPSPQPSPGGGGGEDTPTGAAAQAGPAQQLEEAQGNGEEGDGEGDWEDEEVAEAAGKAGTATGLGEGAPNRNGSPGLSARPVYSRKQADVLLNATARLNMLGGAVRSGKSFISYDAFVADLVRDPEGESLLIAKTERTLVRNVLRPMQHRFGRRNVSRIGADGEVTIFGHLCYAVGANDERAQQKIQGMGAGLKRAYGDEVTTWPASFFQMLLSRLSEPGARFFGTFNPDNPRHWLKRDWLDRGADLNLRYWHFQIDDNPFLDPDFVASLKREYTGVWYQRYILGLWVAAEGAIWDTFDAERHVVDALPPLVRTWWACDYGTGNPTVFLLFGEGTDGRTYVTAEWRWDSELQRRQLTDRDYSLALAEFLGGQKSMPGYVDPSAASFIVQLRRDGFRNVRQANNDVLDGIRTVGTLCGADGLRIHRSCAGLLDEIPGYVWDPKASLHGEDRPLKVADHGPDALRYGVYSPRVPRRGGSTIEGPRRRVSER